MGFSRAAYALSFNATKTLGDIKKKDWSPLNASKQSPQAVLQAAGDAYLDMWSNASAYEAVPWGTPCERVEESSLNSLRTTGAPKGKSANMNSMRRYVIDESLGIVDIHCAFSAVGGAADSHEFRLEGGKLSFLGILKRNATKK
ncbi:hypothetical protein BDZ45DRAFT_46451 [Acephala macrosclerotiorum]|nr:hypothetical protein BDZ45DRAFT_46451 [Acephala macrosclerotiorum]